MRNLTLIIFFLFQSLLTSSQVVKRYLPTLPSFTESNIGGYKKSLWFLPYLTENFSEFVSFTEFTVWSHRKVVLSFAIRNDSAFIVTQTEFPLDTPKIYATKEFLSYQDFKTVLDSFKVYEVFTLKDEAEVEQCVRKTEETIDGQKLIGRSETADISDGLQTLIIFFAKEKYRFISYYELDTAKEWCPALNDWNKAINVRNLMKSLFEKHQRQGKWLKQGMKW